MPGREAGRLTRRASRGRRSGAHPALLGAAALLVLGGVGIARGPLAATATSLPTLPGGWQGRLTALLPQPNQVATLMEKRPSISTVKLQLRVQEVGGSPLALQRVIVSAARGETPEYDEKLGISREAFKSYLVFQSVLVSTRKTVKLPVVRDVNRVMLGDAPGLNGVLKGLIIDLRTGELRGPEGFTAKVTPVAPSNAEGALNIVSGFQWKLMGSDSATGNAVKGTLSLLQLADDQIILNYVRTSMIRRVLNGPSEIILSYSR